MIALISVAVGCRGNTMSSRTRFSYRRPSSSPWLLKGDYQLYELYELCGMNCIPAHEAVRSSLPEKFKVQNHLAGSGLPERLRFGYSSI